MTNVSQTKLQIADRLLNGYQSKIAFYSRFKIANHQSQKDKFLQGKTNSPVFKYWAPKIDLGAIKESLRRVKIDQNFWPGPLLGQKKKELLLKIRIVQNRGNHRVVRILSRKLFGLPPKKIVVKANVLLKKQIGPEKNIFLSAQKANLLIARQVLKYHLPYHVVFKKTNARVSALQNTVRINPAAKFAKKELHSLIIHELTHAFRRENGLGQPWKIFKYGFPDYLSTEEGLAGFNEIWLAKNKNKLRLYAARVLACVLANKSGFIDVFAFLRQNNFSPEQAWQITVRVKRGLGDTSQRGAFLKDWLYLAGYLRVKKYLARHKNPLALYYGKIGLSDIQKLNRFNRLKYPRYFFTYDHQ